MRGITLSLLLLSLLLVPALSKELKVLYDKEGVHLEYLLYTTHEGALYCRDLSGLWSENPLWIWNYVDDFWAEAGSPGLLVIFKSFGQIRWTFIHLTEGYKIIGGYLAPERGGELRGVSFKFKRKGACVTLIFYDSLTSNLKRETYWVDIWGRHDRLDDESCELP